MSKLLDMITKYEDEVESRITALQEQNKALTEELAQQSKLLRESVKLAEKHTLALGCCLKHLQQLGFSNTDLNNITFNTLNLQEGQ